MKKGLILEGGAMRGMFTAGVIDVMMEQGIVYDGAIGVSAGAAFGCNYKSKQIGRVIRYNTRFCNDKRYSGISCLLKTGNIFSTEFAYGEVPLKLDPFDFETYQKDPMSFHVVCTDVETGKPVYHDYKGMEDSGFDWIRASASMPVVSKIVEIDGLKLLDGGISDSVPVRYFQSIGFDKNVVVLTQPKGYVKKENKLIPLIKRMYKQYPKMVETMRNRHLVYNETLEYIEEQEKAGKLYVIRPEAKLEISKVEKDPAKLRQVYEQGRKTAKKLIPEIRSYLEA
ncbi:MAG: patatin family protein [Lachnospiraceae bacterium]|nr:patatin family protein [Lachnospiraceae bacterium]